MQLQPRDWPWYLTLEQSLCKGKLQARSWSVADPNYLSQSLQDIPLLWFGVHGVPQRIVWVVLKGDTGRGIPLGMLLAKALLGIGSQPQLLALTQLHNEDVCRKAQACWSRLQRRKECAGSH